MCIQLVHSLDLNTIKQTNLGSRRETRQSSCSLAEWCCESGSDHVLVCKGECDYLGMWYFLGGREYRPKSPLNLPYARMAVTSLDITQCVSSRLGVQRCHVSSSSSVFPKSQQLINFCKTMSTTWCTLQSDPKNGKCEDTSW